MVYKNGWHLGEMFSRVGFIVTNFRLPSKEVVKTYNGRANVEDRIKEGKNTSRRYNTSCHKFEANQARRKMGLLAYNLLHLLREFYLKGEDGQRSVEWLIRRMVKVASRVSYHGGVGGGAWHRHSRCVTTTKRFLGMTDGQVWG